MKSQKDRLAEIGFWALPPAWSPDYQKAVDYLKTLDTPESRKEVKRRYEIARDTINAICDNDSGLQMGKELRYYLFEYNNRAFQHGLHSMPTSFNFMEAFFRYDPAYSYFKILTEFNISFSFEHFLDWFTEPNKVLSLENTLSNFEEETIYSFNNNCLPHTTTFQLNETDKFCLSGASIVRVGSEIVVMMLLGLPRKHPLFKYEDGDMTIFPGKEKIRPSDEYKHELVYLDGADDYQKAIGVTRLDLENKTEPYRYLGIDMGDSFLTFTDDPQTFQRQDGMKIEGAEKILASSIEKLNDHQAIFELAKTLAFLPEFRSENSELTKIKVFDTEIKRNSASLSKKRLYKNAISSFVKFRSEVHEITPSGSWMAPDKLSIFSPDFSKPRTGYWKRLKPWEIGVNQAGFPEKGRTWIILEKENSPNSIKQPISIVKASANLDGENAGYIYVMRNAQHPKNMFKIGLTTKTTNERASQLSSASGVVDHFHVMQEWDVKNCKEAEKLIHEELSNYRVTGRREFFECEYKVIFAVIHEVVTAINAKN